MDGRNKSGHDDNHEHRLPRMTLFAKLSAYDDRSARLAGIALMLLVIFRPQGILGDKRELRFNV